MVPTMVMMSNLLKAGSILITICPTMPIGVGFFKELLIYRKVYLRCISTEHGFGWLSKVKPPKAMLSGNVPQKGNGIGVATY